MEERNEIDIRECTTVEEFDQCVRLQREAFGLPDLELSPRRHLIVARVAAASRSALSTAGEARHPGYERRMRDHW